MTLIAGVDLVGNKKIEFALRHAIYGIGPYNAKEVCRKASVSPDKRVSELTENELMAIREVIDSDYKVEGDLRRAVAASIKLLQDIGHRRGRRHWQKLPCRGQRTRTNARTRKGRKGAAVAGKKKVSK